MIFININIHLTGLGSSAGHQFPSQIPPPIPNFLPHVQQSPQQLIPPPQTHQPLQQVIHPPQAHQTSQRISHHSLNGPPFPAHVNFRPINQSINHTSWAPQYFNPTTSSHSPTSPVSSFASPTSLSSPPPHTFYSQFLSEDINTKTTTQVHALLNCESTFLPLGLATKLRIF